MRYFSIWKYCLLAAVMVVACAEEPTNPEDNKQEEHNQNPPTPPEEEVETARFEAEFSETVKATLDGLQPRWQQGDKISLFGKDGANAEFSLTSMDGSKAVFESEAAVKGPFVAVYPYTASATVENGSLTAEIPEEQRLAGSVIAPGVMVSVASSATDKLGFKSAFALMMVTIEDDGITAITLQSRDGSPLAGKFTVNPQTGEVSSVKDSKDIVKLLPEGESFAPGTYSIAVIPGKKEGIDVSLSRKADIRKGTKAVDGTTNLARNTSFSLGTFKADSQDWGYRIANYADFKAWLADKSNWKTTGEDVQIVGDINMADELITAPITDSYPGRILGNGHCISHVNVESSTSANVGLFGKGYAKEIHDLVLGSEDGKTYDGTSQIVSKFVAEEGSSAVWNYVGPITVAAADVVNVTSFIPVTVKSVVNKSSRTGGIVAWTTSKITISGCHNYGPVTVEDHAISEKYVSAGGILGGQNTVSAEVTVTDCHNHAAVTSTNHCMIGMGGVVGFSYTTPTSLTIIDCTNDGEVKLLYTATHNDFMSIGGIVGRAGCKAGGTSIVSGCVNTGHVYSEAVHQQYVGGIVGRSDGGDISACRNQGKVEIDHSVNATTRFQNIGGILGGSMNSGGSNSVRNCDNTGAVTMKVASSGHNKTPSSSSTFYGVNAGGTVGMCNTMTTIEGNTNSGTVEVENSFKATSASYPATIHVGGILGYDFSTVDRIADNTFAGTVKAKATAGSSAATEVYAGGIVGRINVSTMASGTGSGTVVAESANSGASIYAGSVAGYNGGSIVTCNYSGTVNGAQADENNIIGGGNAPGNQGGDDPQGGTFSVSETAVEFPGGDFSAVSLTASAGEKEVTVTATGLDWLKKENIPSKIAAGKAVIIELLPKTGNVCDTREGVLTFTETGGDTKTVAISQANLYTPVDGFPARWEIVKGSTYTEGNAAGKRWLREGVAPTVCADSQAASPGVGYISAGSTTGGELVYSVAPSGTQNISIGNMGEGDYIQFSVPTVSMPAGTDIDFMVTINTNNNKTPKYWLFEYWDAGEWKAQPRYTATEDGQTRYSLDVYDYDSKNHRTYITTFRLSEAVNGDFIKMRLRAVGPYNCTGGTLVRTPNAYMNFPCMTYQSCVIAAYPGVEAKESTPVKLLQLGNSFTYYNGSAFKLKEICRAEGHATDVRINVKGSQEFEHHLDQLPFSQRLVAEGGYDKVILQDGSYFHAEYGAGDASVIQGVDVAYTPEQILALTKRMTAAVKNTSPSSEIILESVWSYSYKSLGNYLGFGSFEAFDQMQWKGSTEIMAADPNISKLSPIGKAFALARSDQYGYSQAYNWLLYTDNFHPHRYGSYLKACVNYLILFGERFGAHPADCDIPPAHAAKLREIAEKIVFGD